MKLQPRWAVAAIGAVGGVLVLAGCSSIPGTATATPAPSSAATPPTSGAHRAGRGVLGQITAENGTNWTVVTAKGKSFTVALTPQTVFGTKAAPATEQQLIVGTTVRVIGKPAGSTVTAVRIAAARHAAGATAAPTTAAPASLST